MAIKDKESNLISPNIVEQNLAHLSQAHIKMIDDAVDAVGEFGEVHLIVKKGRLRSVTTLKSHDALKYIPGKVDAK